MPDASCKLVLVGNGSVGKSSIVARFVDDGFQKVYKQTVGLDFFEKVIALPRGPARQIASKYGTLRPKRWAAAPIFLVLKRYCSANDVTDEKSFQDVDDWLRLARTTLASKATVAPPRNIFLSAIK